MTTYTIKTRRPGTGNIHSIKSENYEKEIEFGDNDKYAVVLADHYGYEYTTHETGEEAIEKYNELREEGYSCKIIDDEGNIYEINEDYLFAIANLDD